MSDKNRKYRLKPVWIGNGPIGERSRSEPSAVLQIDDVNGGFLTSRLTQAQRDAITDPADGLMIWNTDTNQMEIFAGGLGGSWTASSGGGGGAVNSVFGRSGNVIAQIGDYDAIQIDVAPSGNLSSTNVQAALLELQGDINTLSLATVTASAVSNVPTGNLIAVNVQTALNELQGDIDTLNAAVHVNTFAGRAGAVVPASSDYDAIQIDVTPAGNLSSTNAQAALQELQTDIDTLNSVTHVNTFAGRSGAVIPATSDYDANQIDVSPAGNLTSTDVQSALQELQVEIDTLSIDDMSDVDTTTVPPTSGQILAWDGTNFVPTTPSAGATLATVVSPAANDAAGAVGVSTSVARQDHKHPAQGVSADANNSLSIGTDGLHYYNGPESINDLNDVDTTTIAPAVGQALLWDGTNFVPANVAATRQDVVANIAARNALTGSQTGDYVYVVDASADATVEIGAALYVWDGAAWQKLSEFESLDIADFVGATALLDGTAGLVPQPTTINIGDFLRGDGAWAAAGKARAFASEAAVAPALAGAPTLTEIQTFVTTGTITDTVVFYTGTNTNTDPVTYVYAVDIAGSVTLLRSSGSGAPGIDTVLSVGQPLTASRSIAVNNNTLLIENGDGSTFADTSFEPDRVLISVSTPGAPSDSFIRVSDDETVIQTSSGGVNRIEVLGSEISMLSDGLGVNLRNRTVMRFEDGAASTVGFRAPATIATPVVWNLPVADGTIDQALITNGAGDLSWSAFGKANARVHADEATVAPALAGSPTLAEITTFVTGVAVRDALVYYTGTNLGTDPVTHVYWSDAAGVVTLLRSPGTGAVGIDDVLGVGQQLTADRTIDSNGNVLDIQSGVLGVAPATLLRVRPVDVSMTAANAALTDTASFTLVPGVGTITTSNAVTSSTLDIFPTGFSFLSDPAGNGVVLLNETRLSFQDSVAGNRVAFKAAASIPANVVWTLPIADGTVGQAITTNGTGTLSWSSIAKNRVFASETAVAPALAGSPNLVEITAFVTTGSITDTLVYYTGTNTNTDAITHVYAVDAAGVVTALRVPGSSTSGLDDVLAVGQTIAANRLVEVSNSTLTTIGTNTTTADSTNLSINSTQVQIDSVSALGNSSGVSLSGGVIGISSNNAATLGPNGLATITMNSGVMDIAGGLNVSLQSAAGGILMVAPANGVNIEQGTSLKFKENPLNGSNTVGFTAPTTITTDVLWTLPAADGTSGQVLSTNGAGVLSWASAATPFTETFNATTDWGTASGGYYTITTPAASHGIAAPVIVQVWEDTAGDFDMVQVDRTRIASNGDVSIRVTQSPDGRFAGRMIVQ